MKLNIKNILAALAVSPMLMNVACTNLDETVYDQLTDDNLDLSNQKELTQMLGAAVTNYRYLVSDWGGIWYFL